MLTQLHPFVHDGQDFLDQVCYTKSSCLRNDGREHYLCDANYLEKERIVWDDAVCFSLFG